MATSLVDICSPGHGASCALCCGSHNYRAGREEIETLFRRRYDALHEYNRSYLLQRITASRSDMTGSYYYKQDDGFHLTLPALFADCPRCPFVVLRNNGPGVGCLFGRDESIGALRSECFLSYRGKIFSCRAREALGDDEILYAARRAGDWFYYSILIHSPDILRALRRDYPDPAAVPGERWERARHDLEERITGRRELHAVHTYFF